MNHEHRVTQILKENLRDDTVLQWVQMDCPVMPYKLVLLTGRGCLKLAEVFDPHFSNPHVVARFPATEKGWQDGEALQQLKETNK